MTLTVSAGSSSRSGRRFVPPRFGTPRTLSRATHGPNVGRIAEALGKPFLPWQQHVVDVALEIDEVTGLPAYGEVILIVMRQQGKTEILLPVMTHRCTGFGPMQRVLYTTQTSDKAREKWRDTHVARLLSSPLAELFEPRYRLNQEAMIWQNGSFWSPGSTTGKTGGTGDTLDLGVIDEMWSRPDFRTELGMRPAMVTRPARQLWGVSMVPGLSRALPSDWPYMRAKMRAGRARVEAGVNSGVAYFEWSAEPGLDPADPATWWSCMPALGWTITEKTIGEDFEAFDLVDFEAEYLGVEPMVSTRLWKVVSEATWAGCLDSGSEPVEPIALCVDSDLTQSWTSIGAAGLRADGSWHVELVDRRPGQSWAEDVLPELCARHRPCVLTIARGGPASPLIRPMELADLDGTPLWTPNTRDEAAGSARFLEATGEFDAADRRLFHRGQFELTQAVAAADKYMFGDLWKWTRAAGSAQDISALYAVTGAIMGGEQVEWAGGGYDIMDSLG